MLRKLIAPIQDFGAVSGILYCMNQVFIRSNLRFRVFVYELMAQPIASSDKMPANFAKSFTVREIPEDDPLLAEMPPPADTISSRFRQNAVCLGAFRKGELIGYQWFCFGEYEEDEVRCIFQPAPEDHTVFDFDIYLYPEHRLGLGFVALWDAANKYLRERGITHTTSRVSRFNTASRKSHQHLGWHRIGRAVFLVGKQSQLMLATVRPFVHFSFSGTSRPRVQLRVEG